MQPPAGSYPEPGQMPAYGQVPASPPPGGPGSPVGPGGPGFQPPSGGSSSRRGLGIAIAAVVGLFVLVGLGFVITTLVGRVEDSIEAQPDLNEATIEQLEEVTTDAELSRSDSDCIEDEMDGQATLNEVFTDTTGDAREAMVQAMLDCIPDPANSDLLVGSFGGNMELALDGQIEVDSEEGGCMVQYILDNSPNPARTLSEADGPQDAQILVESFELCLDEQDLALVTGAAGVGPQAYGDDPRLDLLHDDCGAGDDRACDVLYFQSSAESQYEDFALDCGGRGSAENGWCTADVDFDVNGEAAVDDPGLLAQLALCEQGDWTACDFVFMTAPFGSDVGDIGFTCGGEIPVGALPDCRTRLG